MVKKITLGLLVFLVIVAIASINYALNLGKKLENLERELTNLTLLEQQQNDGISNLSDNLTAFKHETSSNLGNINKQNADSINNLNRLQNSVTDITSQLSQLPDITLVYPKVARGVVNIGNGRQITGSGFVIDNKGHIATASHVVAGLSQIYVQFQDNSTFVATVTGNSPESDVAVLSLKNPTPQPMLTLVDSNQVHIGQQVLAVGNPFGLEQSLATGVISGADRFVTIEYDALNRRIANLLQFDAAINRGNSGGPLFDDKGGVIGMVIARIKPNLGDGVDYAVSSNKLKRITAALIDHGFFDYPWLGIEASDITPLLALSSNRQTASGAVVNSVIDGSPALAAGLKANDIILSINGLSLRGADDLASYMGLQKSVGDEVTLTILRESTSLGIKIKVGRYLNTQSRSAI